MPSIGFVILFSYLTGSVFNWLQFKWSKRYSNIILWITFLLIVGLSSIHTIKRNWVWRDAYNLWKDTSEKTRDNALVYINLGVAADERGLRGEAIMAYNNALRIAPYSAEVYNNLGIIYYEEGELDKAIENYQKARTLTSNYDYLATIHENLGNAYFKKELLDMAIEEYRQTIQIGGRNANLYNKLGIVYEEKGLIEEAIANFKEAVSINPSHEGARKNMERMLKKVNTR